VSRWIAAVIVVAVVAIAAIVIVAAGSGSDDEAGASTAGADPEQMAAFRDCLTEHGAELPEPPGGEPGQAPPSAGGLRLPRPSAKTQRAIEACSALMPQPPAGAPSAGDRGAVPIPQD
jgi:hypothetical protein